MRLDDLTIFLRAVDQTKRAFASAKKNVAGLNSASELTRKGFKLLGGAITTALTAAAANGGALTRELNDMAVQLDITLQEAHALFLAVQNADASVNLDNLNEALLSVKERFADATVGAGPLLGLMQDFEGFELDLGTDNARDQLADFLEQVSELPDANAKIFALKEVIGDEDARPFFRTIQNTEKLNQLLVDLRTNVEDVDGVFSAVETQAVEDARASAAELSKAWDDFSISVYTFIAPAINAINTALAKLVDGGTFVVRKVSEIGETFRNFIRKQLGTFVDPEGIQLTEDAANRILEIERAARAAAEAERDEELEREKRRLQAEVEAKAEAERQKREHEAFLRDATVVDLTGSNAVPTVIPDGSGDPSNDFIFDGTNINPKLLEEAEGVKKVNEEAKAAKDSMTELSDSFGTLGNALSGFASLAGRNNEKTFRSFQILQIALSTAAAITAAIKVASELPPGAGFARVAAYASVLGTLLGGVAQIRQLSLGSTASAPTAQSTGTASTPTISNGSNNPQAPVQPGGNREININITGVLGDAQVTTLAEQIAAEINDNDNITLTGAAA